MMTKQSGRPKLPDDQKLKTISARLNNEEIAILDQMIKDGWGGTRSEVIRWLIWDKQLRKYNE